MGVLDLGVNLLERLRLGVLVPSLDIAVEGSARLCTSDHIPIYVLGAPDPPPGPVHIDVSLRMWNKGTQRIALLEQREARAAGQELRNGTLAAWSAFEPLTLEPGDPMKEVGFTLSPVAQDEPLAASSGDQVKFRLRTGRNGRDRRVAVTVE
jgi:hypothetical protein